jgi:hypothetical protein
MMGTIAVIVHQTLAEITYTHAAVVYY